MSVEFSEFRTRSQSIASQPLLLMAIALALGITSDRYGGTWLETVSAVSWWVAALVATVLAAVAFTHRYERASLTTLLLAVFCLGGTWHDLHWNYLASDELARVATSTAEPVCLEVIAEKPSQWSPAAKASPLRAIPAEPRSEVEVTITRLRNGGKWQNASGNARLRVNGILPDITPGDRLLVYARVAKSNPTMNPGQYDYANAERAAGRHCELFTQSPACVSVVEPAGNFLPPSWLATAGRWCQWQLARYVGYQQQGIAQALLLGVRGELDDETLDAFMKTGTIHLLVVSGMHVGLLAGIMWFLSGVLPLSQSARLLLTLTLVVGYATVVGWQPSVVRSTVLVVITMLAIARFRQATTANCLAASALLVLAINPSELFRAGTQLSFLGVAAVVASASWFVPKSRHDPLEKMIESYMTRHESMTLWFKHKFWQVSGASLAVLVLITPLVLFHFNIVSPSAFVLTPLAWLPMSLALLSALAICTLGFLAPPIAWILGKLCGGCLVFSNALIENAVNVPGSYFHTAGPALWWVLMFYGALGAMAVVPGWRLLWKWQAAIAALWIAVGLLCSAWQHQPNEKLKCSVLAVGHGTCVVLEFPSGETLLYDAGSLGSPQGTTNLISSYLWSQGIRRIDGVVISHADVDHYNALPGLLERFGVGTVYVSPLMFDPWATAGQLTAPNFLKETIEAAGVPMKEVWMNDHLRVADDRVKIEILHPPRFGVPGRDNANSILLSIEFAGRRILLPGDLESPGIEAVIAEPPHNVDVLLAPHHGSNFSDPPGFAAWCTPEWVVLSGRYTAQDTRVTTKSYREIGAEIFHTAQCGAVVFTVDTSGIVCEPFR